MKISDKGAGKQKLSELFMERKNSCIRLVRRGNRKTNFQNETNRNSVSLHDIKSIYNFHSIYFELI